MIQYSVQSESAVCLDINEGMATDQVFVYTENEGRGIKSGVKRGLRGFYHACLFLWIALHLP